MRNGRRRRSSGEPTCVGRSPRRGRRVDPSGNRNQGASSAASKAGCRRSPGTAAEASARRVAADRRRASAPAAEARSTDPAAAGRRSIGRVEAGRSISRSSSRERVSRRRRSPAPGRSEASGGRAPQRSSPSRRLDAGTAGLTGTRVPLSTTARWLGAKRGASRPSLISRVTWKRLNLVAGM